MPDPHDVFIGTYTTRDSRGIYRLRVAGDTGEILAQDLAAEAANPSFLALHPHRDILYAVNELRDFSGMASGAVSAFAIGPSARLTPRGQVATGGALPAHVVVDRSARNLLIANYQGPQSVVFRLGADGAIGTRSAFLEHQGRSVHLVRQSSPHPHSLNPDPDNRFVLVPDLGTDQVLVYRFDPDQGLLAPSEPGFAALPPGSGPRHLAFHPSGRWVYVICELTSEIVAFAYDPAQGILREFQTLSILPPHPGPENCSAEIAVHPNGRFIYGSIRGCDTIAVLSIDQASGRLAPVEHVPSGGRTPRHFAIEPKGRFMLVANQHANTVVAFRISPTSGRLTPTGSVAEVPTPACVRFGRS